MSSCKYKSLNTIYNEILQPTIFSFNYLANGLLLAPFHNFLGQFYPRNLFGIFLLVARDHIGTLVVFLLYFGNNHIVGLNTYMF